LLQFKSIIANTFIAKFTKIIPYNSIIGKLNTIKDNTKDIINTSICCYYKNEKEHISIDRNCFIYLKKYEMRRSIVYKNFAMIDAKHWFKKEF